ncbi:RND family efflux transporter, MFP subunit [Chthonomonas calidirosea]|uniref:efflux RND transporter periplasmic adaptor subunit n=1 Tax=Chthonomonas calidirosea TaxID=454171 RepID=UPI0006DD4F10|nr:efflux RND transporter periplasmic adaptor subunit [Chthonomonas calidirosea]CEK20637.1 RND family efflux transporter, MFP subunit [Chthonomonas calidirosea]
MRTQRTRPWLRSATLNRRKEIGLVVLLPVIGLVGMAFWHRHISSAEATASQSQPTRSNTAITAPVEKVALTTLPDTIEVTGNISPIVQTDIAPKITARILSLPVHEGSHVTTGEVLAVLDTRDLDASIAQAEAGVLAAQAAYRGAQMAEQMEGKVDNAQIAAAQAQLREAQAALAAAKAKQQLVDTGPRKQERAQAALAVAQAKAQLVLAERDLHRMAELYNEGAISAQQYDTYQSRYEVAKAQYESALQQQSLVNEGSRSEEKQAAAEAVRQAESAVRRAEAGLREAEAAAAKAQVRHEQTQNALATLQQSRVALQLARITRSYAVLRAPFDGVITQKLADVGAMAMPGVPILREEGTQYRLELNVPESALPAVNVGKPLEVQIDALGNRHLFGIVTEIAPQGDPSSHTFIVKVLLPAERDVRTGMFGRVKLPIGAERRLLVPASAVMEREGLHYVYVVDSQNVIHLRLVTLGSAYGKSLEVLSGLNPGERIVADISSPKLQDGMQIRPTEEGR